MTAVFQALRFSLRSHARRRPRPEGRSEQRCGKTLVRDLAAVANRIQKLIESANIKPGQIATDVLGYSGQLMLNTLASGETDAEKMAQFAKGKLIAKTARLEQALTGRLTPTQRFLLKELPQQYDHLQGSIDNTQAEIQRQLNYCQDP